ncbi:hypothetical protein, partial [Salmonella enterica]|uniref:hypothetical protein n=1 Tax=Salmonella enterica TaxID=28901 RepID=UPI003D27E87C
MPFDQALDKLKDYQEFSKKVVKIHHCFIKDQNDSEKDVRNMAMHITDWGLKVEFNLVRYNPYSPIQGEESSQEVIERNLKILQDQLR